MESLYKCIFLIKQWKQVISRWNFLHLYYINYINLIAIHIFIKKELTCDSFTQEFLWKVGNYSKFVVAKDSGAPFS